MKQKLSKKPTKPVHSFQNYAYIYKVEILNSFNPELQLKNTESVIKNKLKRVLICYNLIL